MGLHPRFIGRRKTEKDSLKTKSDSLRQLGGEEERERLLEKGGWATLWLEKKRGGRKPSLREKKSGVRDSA